jgi:hypothetical protein
MVIASQLLGMIDPTGSAMTCNRTERDNDPETHPLQAAFAAISGMAALENTVQKSGLEHPLIDVVESRFADQWLRLLHPRTPRRGASRGETKDCPYLLDACRGSLLYSERERALACTETVTRSRKPIFLTRSMTGSGAFFQDGTGQPDPVRRRDQRLEASGHKQSLISSDDAKHAPGRSARSGSSSGRGCGIKGQCSSLSRSLGISCSSAAAMPMCMC